MNKLDFSISLREKGLGKQEIKNEMIAKGFDESEIEYYLKKSDDIFLNQLPKSRKSKKQKNNRSLKIVILIMCLLLLISVFYGYAGIGLLGLFVVWSLMKFTSFK